MVSRRQFLKLGSGAGAGVVLSTLQAGGMSPASAARQGPVMMGGTKTQGDGSKGAPRLSFSQSPGLSKFTQSLRGVGAAGIPLATPDAVTQTWWQPGVKHYTLSIGQFTDQLHPSLPNPTKLWGYNPAGNATPHHLGGIIVAQKGVPVQITATNNLPANHILPVDKSLNFPDAATSVNRSCIHLHGGLVPWISDGGPLTWVGSTVSGGGYGPSAQRPSGKNIYQVLNPSLGTGQIELYYPNQQSARMVWYHDHAHDTTRLNAYAGIASAYIIRDTFEASLRARGLPEFIEKGGARELPIVIQDKIFCGTNLGTTDPTWPVAGTVAGDLWYPHTYDTARWGLSPTHPNGLPPDPSCIPEMFGDTMLANGLVYPHVTVEARRYRLRILNACQARFLNLQLFVEKPTAADGIDLSPDPLIPTNAPGPDWLVLGTEGGFLAHPVKVQAQAPFNPVTLKGSLITAPAERWDVIVDFSGFAGQNVIMYNDAPAPFPFGDPLNDYFPYPAGAAVPPGVIQPTPGFGPNTRQIMRFNVVPATGTPDGPMQINYLTDLTPGIDPSLTGQWTTLPQDVPPGVPVRQLTLNEDFDGYGRLLQRCGTNALSTSGTFGRSYMEPSTENVARGSTEVWEIANLTGDTHPIHFHLVNVQLLARFPFEAFYYSGVANRMGAATGPDPTEMGWKETIKMHPGEVTRVLMRFDLPNVPFAVPLSTNPNLGLRGHQYVWHCHILDHEEHDMMRPLVVI